MLRHEDVKHFKGMLRKADNTYVRDHKLARPAMEALRPDVEQALHAMQVLARYCSCCHRCFWGCPAKRASCVQTGVGQAMWPVALAAFGNVFCTCLPGLIVREGQ